MLTKTIRNIALALTTVCSAVVVAPANAQTHAQRVGAAIFKDIGQATWVAEGKGTRIVYIFFDPNCPYCHQLYVNTRTWLHGHNLQFRWIPVGVLMPSSAGKAAAILSAKDPLQAFHQNEDQFQRGAGFGGVEESLVPPAAIEKRVRTNRSLLERSGLDAVPALLFHDDSGNVQFVVGAPPPPELAAILNSAR